MKKNDDQIVMTPKDAWTILDRSADPILVFDADTFEMCHSNPSAISLAKASHLNGCALDNLSSWLNLSLEETRTWLDANIDADQSSVNLDVRLANLQFDVCVQRLLQLGPEYQIVTVFRDITKRHETERRRQELVSTVSHELRSPLTAIKGAMGLVLAGSAGEIPKRVRDMVQISLRNADRLILIINDILDLDKIADGEMAFDNTTVNLTKVVDAAVESIAGFSERFDVRVAVAIDAHDPLSFVDPNRMVQVLVNLLSNAIKFSPTGGEVKINLTQTDKSNLISIADKGEGIPEAEQASLFQRFVQIGSHNRAATGGTGLGLSIVQAILEKQGGKISFESKVGQGTTFYVDIPIHAEVDNVHRTSGKQVS